MPDRYRWQPIADFDGDPRALTDGELESLLRVWKSQKSEFVEGNALDEFDKRLRREWAIETGIIEGVYTLDRGVTRTLIEKGIDAALIPHDSTNRDSTLVARIVQDHYDVLEGLLDFVGGQRQLSTSYIRELHAALLRNQETYTAVDQFGNLFEKRLEKGEYKTEPNNPTRPDGSIHEYCPPEHVASEMDRLVAMHAEHAARGVPPEVESAWLHHRFAQIHPFADGNGRVARALASLVFIRAEWFPVVVGRDERARYIEALERADAGDLRPLVVMFVEAQRNALMQATEVAYDVKPPASPEEAIAAVRERLERRGKLPLREWRVAEETANRLLADAQQRLVQLSQVLKKEIGASTADFADVVPVQTGDTVQKAGLAADVAEYGREVRFSLNTCRKEVLVLSFYAVGPQFRGIVGVLACFSMDGAEPVVLPSGHFLINYEEEIARAQVRFFLWLEVVLVEGLNQWRLTL